MFILGVACCEYALKSRVATVREKSLVNEFFPGQRKVREFQF